MAEQSGPGPAQATAWLAAARLLADRLGACHDKRRAEQRDEHCPLRDPSGTRLASNRAS
jgi:hypothetical protein